MTSQNKNQLRIEGTVAPGFESVRQLYVHNMESLEERNTQLCVYHKGERVVDLWASAIGDDTFSPDTLVNIFSSGKSLAALAMASLVDQGHLDYNEKISTYWPEFAANGKGDLIVADLMRHEAGLAAFNTSLPPEDLHTENIKKNLVGSVIEAQTSRFPKPPASRREYHAITRGWVANEIFRRADPAGRTIGEFLREDVSGPLEVDAMIGVREEDLPRISPVVPLGFLFTFLESLKPRFLGRRIERNIFQLIGRLARIIVGARRATVASAPPPFKGMTGLGNFNDPAVVRGETPSANANCTARGLAKIAAMLSGGGSWNGRQYLSAKGWDALHGNPVFADMSIMPSFFSQGGVNEFVDETSKGQKESVLGRALNDGRQGFFGWMGLGGSIFQWHPRHDIGFGYVPTSLNVLDILNERGKEYQREVVRCVENLSSD